MNLLALPALAAAAYHGLAIYAGFRKWREPSNVSQFKPPVSILKPVRGGDEQFARALESHAGQRYPDYEILFGLSDTNDSAREEIEQFAEAHPELSVKVIVAENNAPNTKVGVLERLAEEAKYPVLVVNDSDITVEPEYLAEVVSPLGEPQVGLVTCLYRGRGGSFATKLEALGIATEFGPSVLVARQTGVQEFAMGSTLAFRASDLKLIGGFAAIRDFLADDYQLGKRLNGLPRQVVLARPVVETYLGSGGWRDVWMHQARWSRTIRVSRPGGYLGYGITHSLLWCAVAAVSGSPWIAAACYAVRLMAALWIAGVVMRDQASLRMVWWLPLRDAFGIAIWVAGWTGGTVEWRGRRLRLDPSGRVTPQ